MTEKIVLALSGGGSRAMAFHAGVLRFLAERDALERVAEVSSVSGGSLVTGLIFARSGMLWPSSSQYLREIYPEIRRTLTSTNIQTRALMRLLSPNNWRYFGSRPNLVARAIHMDWRIRCKLEDLPSNPVWTINCTAAENGKRFRFMEGRLGDQVTGYAEVGKFPLASAMATSAAFPVGIGPFRLYSSRLSWVKRPFWNAKHEEPIPAPFDVMHLYDGGLYDNLGLEAFFDAGKLQPKESESRSCKNQKRRIVVSDAGAPLWKGFSLSALNPLRVKRQMDVMMDQNRALRVRGFVSYISDKKDGAYLGIVRTAAVAEAEKLDANAYQYMTADQIHYVTNFPTSLLQLAMEDFDLIARHGYETARLNELGFPYLP